VERIAFTLLHEIEESWWYRGRIAVVRGILTRAAQIPMTILDFGAGYGGMYDTLATKGPVFAFEPDAQARSVAQARKYEAVYGDLPTAFGRRYDMIGLFDVLEHLEEDGAFLTQAHNALVPKGQLLLTVPAMPFLWGPHDVSHHHFRRYTRHSLQRTLEEAGYTLDYVSYWNMFLFLPAAIARLMGRGGESALGLPRAFDALLYAIIKLEVLLMRVFPLPFGISIVALAHKK